jgi:hypothetical protein
LGLGKDAEERIFKKILPTGQKIIFYYQIEHLRFKNNVKEISFCSYGRIWKKGLEDKSID